MPVPTDGRSSEHFREGPDGTGLVMGYFLTPEQSRSSADGARGELQRRQARERPMPHHRHVRAPRAADSYKRTSRTISGGIGADDALERTVRWRREARPKLLRRLVRRTNGLRWSAALFDALMDELMVGDEEFVALLGPTRVATTQYPQAIAVALALRHSWNEVSLREFTRRLRLPRP